MFNMRDFAITEIFTSLVGRFTEENRPMNGGSL